MPKHVADDSDSSDEVGPPRPPAGDDDADVGPPRPPPGADDDVADVGPPRPDDAMETDAAPKKKRKAGLEFEQLYLDVLPNCEMYEKSYMHRGTVTDVIVTCNDFIITASTDGQVKFWKKAPAAIEFVKHFRAHLEPITGTKEPAAGLSFCPGP